MQHTMDERNLLSCGYEPDEADGLGLNQLLPKLLAWKIKDVIVVHHGTIRWKWHVKQTDRVGAIYSSTKSFLSALIGMAVEQGYISSLDQPIADYFEEIRKDSDERKRSIRIKDLMSMTAGLEWPEFDKPYWQMKRTKDWIDFIVKQPMAHVPGEVFTYNSGASHLLSAILTRTTELSASEYAELHLFKRLGFRKSRWNSSGGVSEGGAGLHLTALDMAKFGQLYLQKGSWNGEQLIPSSWIDSSTCVHHKGFQHYEPPIFGEYGYHWWISSKEHNGVVSCYFAKGYGGQYIFVIPERDAVVVVRREAVDKSSAMASKQLLFEHIIPAISE
ncbi:serine hydrolase domain-containing protein [Paenibacillus solisilvae]|uniref:Serine hydrolase domain-containing protein n=1 Tax=Paenibacillus solisilvae TaxID=2486751 RepID=A0ABW0VUK3_9BACL